MAVTPTRETTSICLTTSAERQNNIMTKPKSKRVIMTKSKSKRVDYKGDMMAKAAPPCPQPRRGGTMSNPWCSAAEPGEREAPTTSNLVEVTP